MIITMWNVEECDLNFEQIRAKKYGVRHILYVNSIGF